MPTTSLSELQTWFLTVMSAAGGVRHGLDLARQRFGWDAQQVVAQTSDVSAVRRMNIYAEGYVLRLLECLQTDYPVLHKVMGEPLFNFFAKAYIWQQPSVSPTLYDLGAGFAAFLRASQRSAAPEMADMLLLPIELARLERARSEATRARGLEQARHPSGVGAFDLMLGLPLAIRRPPCLRLLQLELPLLAFWEGVARGGDIPPAPAPAASHVAVSRMHYRVNLLNLEAWQYHFLAALDLSDTPACTSHALPQPAWLARRTGIGRRATAVSGFPFD
ncbi:MAG: putative DNA-binding domain-containing protein [Burkholderiales bacterium]|nr:putative DNA-binding domain-containing protein [Burkholderiales bacterium]